MKSGMRRQRRSVINEIDVDKLDDDYFEGRNEKDVGNND
jgi:hypothetical protein